MLREARPAVLARLVTLAPRGCAVRQDSLVRPATQVLQALTELLDQAGLLATLVELVPQDPQVKQAIRGLQVRRERAVRRAAQALREIAVPPETQAALARLEAQARRVTPEQLDRLATEATVETQAPPVRPDYEDSPEPQEALALAASLAKLGTRDLQVIREARVHVASQVIQGQQAMTVSRVPLVSPEKQVLLVRSEPVLPDPPEAQEAPRESPARPAIKDSLVTLDLPETQAIRGRRVTLEELVRLVRGE